MKRTQLPCVFRARILRPMQLAGAAILMNLLIFPLAAADEDPAAVAPARPQLQERYPRYRIHASDVVEIQYRYTPEYNFAATVQPDGFISSSMTGDVHIEGMTIEEAASEIAKHAERLNDPVVAVVLREFVKPRFYVAGEVARPGTFDLRGDVSLIEAISMSGGFLQNSAKRTQVVLVRKSDPDTAHVRVYDARKLMTPEGIAEDVPIMPDDVIIVPRNFISKIAPFVPIGSLATYGLGMWMPRF